ncbi:hypothetical protein [Oceanobacillus kapialis]|uniref:Uncharacterized protein n=1 Tax=Oceanobacillus kapialis TaxID=481353 RepID=A0ABW5Q593_9BACI
MKKQSYFTTNEQGFVLPAVLLIIAIVFVFLFHNTSAYRNELSITDTQLEQTKIETLYQASRQLLIDELKEHGSTIDTATYTFPYGNVAVHLQKIDDAFSRLTFTITTDKNAVKSFESTLALEGLFD